MKNLVMVLSLVLLSSVLHAQKMDMNTEKSSIEWLGKKIGGEHSGFIELKSGFVEEKNNMLVAGKFIIDMTSITNTDITDDGYKQKLVGHLKSDDFFGVDKYPTAKFVLKKATEFKGGKASVTGDITIKDKTEEISFDVTKKGNGYNATLEIDRSKFDVRYGSNSFFDNLGDKAIDDMFWLTIKLSTK